MDLCPIEVKSIVSLDVQIEGDYEVEAEDECDYSYDFHSYLLGVIVGNTKWVNI